MQISYNTKERHGKIKQACLRVNSEGRFILNNAAVKLLELEDSKADGVIFGYQNGCCYIAYSASPNAYKGNFKKGETAFRFNSKSEALKLLLLFKEDKVNLLIDENNIVVAEAHKFYLLKKIHTSR